MIIHQTLKKTRQQGRKRRLGLNDVLRRDGQRRAERQMIRIKRELVERDRAMLRLRGIYL